MCVAVGVACTFFCNRTLLLKAVNAKYRSDFAALSPVMVIAAPDR
jgi:hypothetical protein